MLEFIVNKDTWESLPPDLQAIVTYATRAINQDMLDEYTARNNSALKELVDKHGVQLRKLPDDVVDALRIASKQVIQETIAEDETAKKVYESFQSFRADVMPYTAISEAAFLEIRGDD